MTLHENFRDIFWDAFHRPKFLSDKYKERWEDIESLNDLLAGPMFSIYEKGNCNYVFEDKERFSFVHTKKDFFDWLNKLCLQYRAAVEELAPENAAEEHDANILRFQCDMKDELCQLANEMIAEIK